MHQVTTMPFLTVLISLEVAPFLLVSFFGFDCFHWELALPPPPPIEPYHLFFEAGSPLFATQ